MQWKSQKRINEKESNVDENRNHMHKMTNANARDRSIFVKS